MKYGLRNRVLSPYFIFVSKSCPWNPPKTDPHVHIKAIRWKGRLNSIFFCEKSSLPYLINGGGTFKRFACRHLFQFFLFILPNAYYPKNTYQKVDVLSIHQKKCV
jgi:hypothetical protein